MTTEQRYHIRSLSPQCLRHYSFRTWFLTTFALFYLYAIYYCHTHYYRDPTSIFFDVHRAYKPEYSSLRRQQAQEFIHNIEATNATFLQTNNDNKSTTSTSTDTHPHTPELCIGIASVARSPGVLYVDSAIGSLLAGLTAHERSNIHLILFMANVHPELHPLYNVSWPHQVVDEIITWNDKNAGLSDVDRAHLQKLEDEKDFLHKGLLDYQHVLRACTKTEAAFIATFEDDVIALDGWYHRMWRGLKEVEKLTHYDGAREFYYLRLFYTEEFLGWNSESWPTYLTYSVLLIFFSTVLLIALRHNLRSTSALRSHLTNRSILFVTTCLLPLCIILFFAAGKLSMLPISDGVLEMPGNGCCAQGLVFPKSQVSQLVAWYDERKDAGGYLDVLMEELAVKKNKIRWALSPGVVQHGGGKSTKGDEMVKGGRGGKDSIPMAQRLWSFGFEKKEPEKLRKEHEEFGEVEWDDIFV